MIRPEPFKKGDKLAVLCGSSASHETPDVFEQNVRAMGLEPVLYPTATARHGNLAGTDEQKAADINAAFADDCIRGIVMTRGGYGFQRVLPLIDWELLKKHPKFVGGYSDVTGFLSAYTQFCDCESYHMTMVSAWGKMDDYTKKGVEDVLFGRTLSYENPAGCSLQTVNGGKAQGRMTGGNLSLLAASMGTPYDFDAKGKIIFIEEVHEEVYRVDRMLVQLRNGGKFDECAGVVFGQFADYEEPERGLTLAEVIDEIVRPCGKPIIKGLECGHAKPTMVLPMGREFLLDADACVLKEV